MPSISCGVVGVSSGGHPGMEVVVPDAPVELSLGPPGPAIAPHCGDHAWQPPPFPNNRNNRREGTLVHPKAPEHPKGEKQWWLSERCLPPYGPSAHAGGWRCHDTPVTPGEGGCWQHHKQMGGHQRSLGLHTAIVNLWSLALVFFLFFFFFIV